MQRTEEYNQASNDISVFEQHCAVMEEQKQQMEQDFEEAVLKVEELEGKVEAADLLIENLHNQL